MKAPPSKAPVVLANGLTRHYDLRGGLFAPKTKVRALDGVSFRLEAGKTLAVVGESGCGKSTLARLVTMIEPPTEGELILEGEAIRDQAKPVTKGASHKVQIVFQDPYGSLNPRQKIGAILSEPLRINCPELSGRDREHKAREMLELVGLRPEHFDRYPHMFSGGQRQRIAIGRSLMLTPKVLVLDEPVSALDLSIQSQILNLLVDLQDRFRLAYLFISHDLSVVKHIADEVMVMYLGRPVESGSAASVFSQPRHPYTKALLSATPVADPKANKARIKLEGELPSPIDPPGGCAFHPRCWRCEEKCRQAAPELAGEKHHRAACFFPLRETR